jgi:glycosyltransferase involved in cell wall biosynthesis
MRPPAITCVIPTFQAPDLVGLCLASVLAQRGVDLEVVVTDDSPSDAVRTLIGGRPGMQGRVIYTQGPRSGNPVHNWNQGLSLATAPLRLVVHQDEQLADPDYLRRAVDALVARPDAAAAIGAVQVLKSSRPSRFAIVSPVARRLPGARELLPLVNWIGPTAAFVFRAGHLFDPALVQLVDVEFYQRVLRTGPAVRLNGLGVTSLGRHSRQITARIDPIAVARRELAMLATRSPPAISPTRQAVFSALLSLRSRG